MLRGVYVPDIVTILATLYFILGRHRPVSSSILAVDLAYWQQSILRSVGVLVAVLLPAGTFVYLFLFKMVSFMQSRLGPTEAGPYGSMQLLAEVGKWLQKEDIVPEPGRPAAVLQLAPYLVVASVLLVYVAVPVRPRRLVRRPRHRHLLRAGRVVAVGASAS